MTRKDYVAIAAAVRASLSATPGKQAPLLAQNIVESIACVMERDSPRFDRERFLKACGV